MTSIEDNFAWNAVLRIQGIPDPDPYIWLTDPNPGGPKKYGCGAGSGSKTLLKCAVNKFSRFFSILITQTTDQSFLKSSESDLDC